MKKILLEKFIKNYLLLEAKNSGLLRLIDELYVMNDKLNLSEEEKFKTAESFFKSNCSISNIVSRFNGNNLKAISESVSRNYSEGIIRYNYTFSNNKTLTYTSNDIERIDRKVTNSLNLQKELQLYSTFVIPEFKELLQKQPNLLPESKSKRSNISINSKAKFADLIGLADFNDILEDDELITDSVTFRFSPKKREFSADLNYYQLRQ